MATLNDAKFEALRALGFTGAISDMTLQWLQDNGATSGAISDAWHEALFATGLVTEPFHINDAWFAVLGTGGHIGSINDRELSFWENYTGGPIGGLGYQSDNDGLNFVNFDGGAVWDTDQDFEIIIEMIWDGTIIAGNFYLFRFGEIGGQDAASMNFGVGFTTGGNIVYGMINPAGTGIAASSIGFGRENVVVTVRFTYDATAQTIEREWTTEDGDSGVSDAALILTTRQHIGTNVLMFAEIDNQTQNGMLIRNATMSVDGVEVVNAVCDEGAGLVSVNTGAGVDGVISREEVHISSG